MIAIDLVNVSLDFPIYSAKGRSIRTDLLRRIGGRIQEAEESGRLVVRALRDINLSLRSGDRLGLIGPNGSGKSTLLRVMAGVYEPPLGTVRTTGKRSSLLNLTLGMDPELTGYQNILLRGVVLGMSLAEAWAKTPEIADFSELGAFLDLPVRTYSSGMLLRLAFAISTVDRPDILLLDEMISAGDDAFATKASARIDELVNNASILVLASHNHQILRRFCTQVAVLARGEIHRLGPTHEVLDCYSANGPVGTEIEPDGATA
jgi:ABC-type polysaccharide/polyol phosphate transport system ATPase subunit